jgi:enoyl-CoA hydratase
MGLAITASFASMLRQFFHAHCGLRTGLSVMTYKSFNVTLADHVAHVQLARPDAMNSMNADFWLELPLCMRELEASGEARVIVISSTGKHFSAGMDLGVFTNPKAVPMGGDPARMAENLRRVVMQLQASLSSLEEVRLPVLVAIQGGCIGGALDMVCAADSRYCSADAYFTIKETELGMTADVGTLQRLPKLLPQGVVRELAYTGRKFGADEAKALGFVNQVYASHAEMLDAVLAIAAQIASHSPLAVSGCKEMLNFSRDHSVADSLKYMATWQSGMFRPNEMLKTFQAKATKTTATFDGLFPVKGLFEQ